MRGLFVVMMEGQSADGGNVGSGVGRKHWL